MNERESEEEGDDLGTKAVARYLADPRLRCCLEAAAEITALLKIVQACIHQSERTMLHVQTRAMLARAMRLCSLLQDGMGDETVATAQMLSVLNLEVA